MMTTSSARAVVGLRRLGGHLPLRARLPVTVGWAARPAFRVTRADSSIAGLAVEYVCPCRVPAPRIYFTRKAIQRRQRFCVT
jgi:hypothetical protein